MESDAKTRVDLLSAIRTFNDQLDRILLNLYNIKRVYDGSDSGVDNSPEDVSLLGTLTLMYSKFDEILQLIHAINDYIGVSNKE